ncbi:MAG: hypothetical protein OCD76_03715 [Reichenbachiella sp.]
MKLPKTLPEPEKPKHLSANIKWLAGEGAGSWFELKQQHEQQLEVSRFSPQGEIECQGTFVFPNGFDLTKVYSMDYPSHCAIVTLLQGDAKYTSNRLEK